jgi:hypothetical protein
LKLAPDRLFSRFTKLDATAERAYSGDVAAAVLNLSGE